MASITLIRFTDLYYAMNSGEISYEEFLDFTDPKNPDGIYKDILGKFEKAIASPKFANIDGNTRTTILDYYKSISKTGDAEIIGIKDTFGLDTSALATHRLLLKQGLKPVLDLTEVKSKEDVIDENKNKEDVVGIPFIFVSDQELANKTTNEYFSFRTYNERGVPGEITVKGTKLIDSNDPAVNKYIYSVFQYGNIVIDKSDPENLDIEGLDGNGDERDIGQGVLNLYPKEFKPIVEDVKNAISSLKKIYSDATLSAGGQFDESDSKEFDQWAYENLRRGKDMKDVEERIFDSPQMRISKNQAERMFQTPGPDSIPALTLNAVPSYSLREDNNIMIQNARKQGLNPINYSGSFADFPMQGDKVPVTGPSESSSTEFIKTKEVPLDAKEFINIGSDFFLFIIIFGLLLIGIIIYRNYKHVGNKTSGRRDKS